MPPTRTKASTLGQPAQPNQSSRKGKKAWRKNIDLTTTETFLEEQSDPLRQTASDVLFVEDRSGQEALTAKQARSKRPLKSLEILQNSCGRAALEPARKKSVDKRMESRLRKMVGRSKVAVQGDAGAIVQQSADVVGKNLDGVYDVWGSTSKGKAKAAGGGQEEWIPAQVAKPPVNVPKTLRRDDHGKMLAATLPAVDLPHPGSSYNPDLESHEALIQQAYEIEHKLEQGEQMDRAEREQWQAKLATIVAREAELRAQHDDEVRRYRGMDVDVPGLNSDVEDEDEPEEEDDDGGAAESKRKTRAQRARAKRARAQHAEAARRKQARIEAAAILQLPALKRRQARLALARQQASDLRREQKQALLAQQGLAGLKVGKHTVPQQKVDVQTGDELAESLRTLRPEGNLFRDRYVRLQARGKVEPRVRQERTRRLKKVKQYETHDYKKFQ